mgnify:FL=1
MKRKKLCSFMMILGLGTGIFVNNTCVLAEDNLEEKIIDIEDNNDAMYIDGPAIDDSLEKSTQIYSQTHSIMGNAEVSKEGFKKYFNEIAEKKAMYIN